MMAGTFPHGAAAAAIAVATTFSESLKLRQLCVSSSMRMQEPLSQAGSDLEVAQTVELWDVSVLVWM